MPVPAVQYHTECWDEPRQQCHSVPRQVCADVPKEICKVVPNKVCNEIEKCKDVPRKECTNEYKEVCVNVPSKQCALHPREVCRNVPSQACRDVPHETCTPVPAKNCQKVFAILASKNRIEPKLCFLHLNWIRLRNLYFFSKFEFKLIWKLKRFFFFLASGEEAAKGLSRTSARSQTGRRRSVGSRWNSGRFEHFICIFHPVVSNFRVCGELYGQCWFSFKCCPIRGSQVGALRWNLASLKFYLFLILLFFMLYEQ